MLSSRLDLVVIGISSQAFPYSFRCLFSTGVFNDFWNTGQAWIMYMMDQNHVIMLYIYIVHVFVFETCWYEILVLEIFHACGWSWVIIVPGLEAEPCSSSSDYGLPGASLRMVLQGPDTTILWNPSTWKDKVPRFPVLHLFCMLSCGCLLSLLHYIMIAKSARYLDLVTARRIGWIWEVFLHPL
jgi:hypothetical protein